MSSPRQILPWQPSPSDSAVDWARVRECYGWAEAMAETPQNPTYHGEGDVWTHTKMVCEALIEDPAWQGLDPEDRAVLFAAAVLHDVGKPDKTREREDGSITSRGHSRRGDVLARQILWRMGAPFDLRERVCGLVRYHQVPFWLLDREDAEKLTRAMSLSVKPYFLALHARADIRGRIAPDLDHLLERVGMFETFAEEVGCLSGPWPFPSSHSRFLYFRSNGRRNPYYEAYDDTGSTVTLMSGLPGAGKDTWLARQAPELPVVSLDELRTELGVDPADNQGPVVQEGRERAREYLRAGKDFAWNATSLSRRQRGQQIRLFADYNARVRIVYVEVPPERLFAQNADREDPVPDPVIEKLMDRWEMPDLTEAHEIVHVIGGA